MSTQTPTSSSTQHDPASPVADDGTATVAAATGMTTTGANPPAAASANGEVASTATTKTPIITQQHDQAHNDADGDDNEDENGDCGGDCNCGGDGDETAPLPGVTATWRDDDHQQDNNNNNNSGSGDTQQKHSSKPYDDHRTQTQQQEALGDSTRQNGYANGYAPSPVVTTTPTNPIVSSFFTVPFADDESKAYYERFSLTWAPLSMALLLGVLLGTPLYKYCDRNSFLIFSCLACLPGFVCPILRPCPADIGTPWHDRFWVKGTVWVSIFGFYGNYFWTHYFYSLLGAEYLFDSYRFNDVPLVTYICTFFYFTFYFTFVNIVLRVVRRATYDFPPFGRRMVWVSVIAALSYGTALFEALSIQHFPLYTYTRRDLFLLVGSVVYGLYFVVGFPMFFMLDEIDPVTDLIDQPYTTSTTTTTTATTTQSYPATAASPLQKDHYHTDHVHQSGLLHDDEHYHQHHRPYKVSLQYVALNAFAACAIVTLLLDLWRLCIGSIYDLAGPQSSIRLPFVYQDVVQQQQAAQEQVVNVVQQAVCSMPPMPSTEIIYVDKPITAQACVEFAKGWAAKKVTDVTNMLNRTAT